MTVCNGTYTAGMTDMQHTEDHAYAELHCHSAFSLLDGASTPEQLVARAAELGYHSLALTDTNDMGGMVRFGVASREHSFNGILGAELTVRVPHLNGQRGERRSSLVLLAETRQGYRNISTLVTRARMDSERGKPGVPLALLSRHSDGVTALTGGMRGWIPQLLAEHQHMQARMAAEELHAIFKDRLAIECWDHRLPEEQMLIPHLRSLSQSCGVPWVVTNAVRYADMSQRMVHDVLSSIRHGRTLDGMGTRLNPNAEWGLKSLKRIFQRWRDAMDGIHATVAIASRCTFRLEELKPVMPAYPVPPGMTMDMYLRDLAFTGAAERWGPDLTAVQRSQLERELEFICRKGYAGFFLAVWGIVRFARAEGILCQGRGSAASSAVCYCLGITAVDPLYFGLLFERFMSEGRQEAPDIDIDFSHRDRERVLQHVYNRYGREHAAMVCEHITWGGRSAMRDAARVLGFSPEQADTLASFSGRSDAGTAADFLASPEGHTRLQEAGFDTADIRVQHMAPIVDGLGDLPRHRSIHVGGFVLSEEPLGSLVPIEPASMPDRTVIQWDKDDLDPVGFFKVDLLGLGMLTVVQDCLRYIRHTRGEHIDLSKFTMDDPAVYDMLCAADTAGVFQVESRAQMNTLPRLKPRCFYDLVVEVALIRPGPLQGQMVHPYLRRRAGVEAVEYLHPDLKPILERTLGVPLFQEQGMQVAIKLAGFTAEQADELRRTMGHKRSRKRMERVEVQLREGMRKNGIDEDTVNRICLQIGGFADYGFPESHAASFALIVYATAWLRLYYAPEYLCAILNAQPMGFYAPGTLIADAMRHGVEVRPADIARSGWDHSLELPDGRKLMPHNGSVSWCLAPACQESGSSKIAVRLGLRLIRNIGAKARHALETALNDGPFTSLENAVARVALDTRAWRSLAASGAFDSLFAHEPAERRRRAALWEILALAKEPERPLAPRRKAQPPASLASCAPVELTALDYRMTGVSLAGHPMKHARPILEPNGVRTADELRKNGRNGQTVAAAGIVICRQRPPTAAGFVFLTMEDETGMINVVVTPDVFARNNTVIVREALLLVRGVLQVQSGVTNIRARKFRALHLGSGEQHVPSHDFH